MSKVLERNDVRKRALGVVGADRQAMSRKTFTDFLLARGSTDTNATLSLYMKAQKRSLALEKKTA